jgi:hypothetical protein
MGLPTSEVGYTSATTGKGDHEVHKGHMMALGKKTVHKGHVMVMEKDSLNQSVGGALILNVRFIS